MDIRKIPYGGHYPSALKSLIDGGLINIPRQRERSTRFTEGVDIDYHLGWNMEILKENIDTLLLAIYEDATRYHNRFPKCGFWAKIYFKHVGRTELPEPIGVHTWLDPDTFVYGPEKNADQTKEYWVRKALEVLLENKYEVTQRLRGIHIRIYQRI